MNTRTIQIAALTVVFTLFSAAALAKAPQTKTSSAKPAPAKPTAAVTPYGKIEVARVAEQPVTREDVIHLVQIEQAYGSALSDADALVIVINNLIAQTVARSVGVEITAAETPKHFPIIDANTPENFPRGELTEAIPANKQPFHADHADYAKLYISPKMLNRRLREFYSTASALHPAEQERIEQALQLALSGKSFGEVAKITGLATAQHTLMEKEIELPAALAANLPTNRNLPQNELFAALNQLSPDKILPKVVEDESGFRVMRLISHDGPTYELEAIEVAKPAFETWLKERARALPVMISDEILKKDIKLKYPKTELVSQLQ